MKSRVGAVAQLLFVDLIGSIAWFPVWWYTTGLQKVSQLAVNQLRYRSQAYALKIWVKNFFVPMYGQYDWAGRLISVLMRFVVIVGRSIALVVEGVIYFFGIILWLIAPPLSILLAVQSGFLGFVSDSATVIQDIPL